MNSSGLIPLASTKNHIHLVLSCSNRSLFGNVILTNKLYIILYKNRLTFAFVFIIEEARWTATSKSTDNVLACGLGWTNKLILALVDILNSLIKS